VAEHLTTGWEDDVPASDSLLRAYVLASADRAEVIARAAGGRVAETERAWMADAASPALFDNVVTLRRPPTAADARAAVADAVDFFPAERPFAVLSAWPVPDGGDLGIELMGHPPFMLRPVGPPPTRPETRLEIRPVEDEDELATFFATIVAAYPMPGGESALASPGILGTSVRFWVGYEDGVPVGTAGVHVGHGLNDVEWISVAGSHRGRGYGAELTWAATLADPGLPAVLIASDPGQPVYERMGYLRLTRMTMWFRPAPDG
jgi:hypothetical protein